MARLGDDAERSGQIHGPDEEHIDAVDGGYCIEILVRLDAFDLQNDHGFAIRRLGDIGKTLTGYIRPRGCDATIPQRGMLGGAHGGGGLLCRVYLGHHDGDGPGIKSFLDETGVVVGDANHRRHAALASQYGNRVELFHTVRLVLRVHP